jgi:decaprenylphospho-beta-D-erythro-pentofuranosid-2-ulose 2-reductase
VRDAFGNPQRVVVFGGGSEIGQALVRRLGRERPLQVILAGRNASQIETQQLVNLGHSVEVTDFDAADFDAHDQVVDRVFERGDVDIAVLAFGVLPDQEQVERDRAAVVASLQTNFVGGVSLLVPLAERMRAQGHGAIVVLSSVAAERPRRANFVYGAAKAGLDSFSQGLADALAGSGVQVLVVRPGFVRTKMTRGLPPAPLATDPDAVADVIADGLRRGAHTVWAPPALRYVMTVLRLLPRPVFRLLRR